MPAKRELTMRQIRELLRLAHDGCSVRDMARRFGVARSTIQDNLKRAREAGLTWPLPDDLTNDFLEQSLFSRTGIKAGFRRRPEPDWALLARKMKRPGVNLSVLWEEYRQVHPEGYGYSRFCELFRDFEHADEDLSFADLPGLGIGARRLQLHLCRGELVAEPVGLDRRPCSHVRVLRRRAAADRA